MLNNAFGLIYTGESNMLLRELTYSRSIAAVPFAGRYRCIDFVLSNLVNSGVTNVGVIAQKNYHSLMDHLGPGKEWDLNRKRDGLFILPPYVTRENTGIYRGTADALRNLLEKLWLPTQIPQGSLDALIERIAGDKKADGCAITIVLLHALGDCFLHKLPVTELAALIRRCA